MMPYRFSAIRRLLRDGYPYKIMGNDGYEAVMVDQQPLADHDYCAVYRYPGGDCCHGLEEIKRCFVPSQELPEGFEEKGEDVVIADDEESEEANDED